jgi:pimeloyl-ACP methyl ester carboxylesterase
MPEAAGIYYHQYVDEDAPNLPVVLLHGAGGMHLYWPPEIRRMKGIQVYALDLPGHGRSAQTGGLQDINNHARAIVSWLQELQLPAAVFVGHSMGGAIALSLALDYPDHVAGLGLIATAANLPVNPSLLDDASHPTTFQKAVGNVVQWSFSTQAPERLVELAHQRMLETRPSVFHSDLRACDRFDVRERVSSIDKPTLIVCGSEDKMASLRNSQFLSLTIPNSTLKVINGAGHMAMLEQPAVVAQALSEFFNGLVLYRGES